MLCWPFRAARCSRTRPQYRGIAVSQHELSELTPGISQQADAQALLGPPTFQEQFAPNNWVYVSQITKMRIGNTTGVKQQHVVVLTFDNNGVLKSITQRDLKNGVNVAMDGPQTPVPGGHAGFMQQLIGGVGSYNPGIGTNGVGPSAGTGRGRRPRRRGRHGQYRRRQQRWRILASR